MTSVVAVLCAAWAASAFAAPATAPSGRPIRFVVPAMPIPVPGERDLGALVDEYNQKHKPPGTPGVQLLRRGDCFSSLKELIALYLAGDPPEIAAIETSELPALERSHLAKPLPAALAASAGAKPSSLALPFQHSMAILVADQAVGPLPSSWEGLVRLASSLAEASSGAPPLALPLEGPRGLWIFETIAGKPLWSREAGGLKTNRSLETPIQALQSLLSPRAPELAASDMTWDRAIQDFLDRKSPLLVTTLDALPLIARKAAFGWKAAALPRLSSSHAQPVIGGSDLIVTQDRPEVWKFLMFLYSKEVAGRWTAQGGFVPLRPDWQQTSAWKQAPQEYRALARTAAAAAKAPSSRTTDPEVVRAHTEWVSALRYLFGESSKRLPTETVFTQLDSTLTQR